MTALRIALVLPLVAMGTVSAEVKVVTSTTDLAALARGVASDDVDVRAIAHGAQDPHHVEARPSHMRRMRDADLLVYNGLELEVGWLPLLVDGSRNRRIATSSDGRLDASKGVEILDVGARADRSHGDVHPEGNPHYTLDPRNGLIVATAIRARLRELGSASEDGFDTDLKAKIREWERRSKGWKGIKVVAHHKQWEYLARWLRLEIVGYIEERPGIPPSPRHLRALMQTIQTEDVALILHSTHVDPRSASGLGERTGVPVVELPAAVAAAAEAVDYSALFETIVSRLEVALP